MRDRFASAGAAPASAGRLAEAALCMAAVADPSVDVDAELALLEALAAGCPDDLAGLRTYLFDRLAFRGDRRHYDDPRNSYLHQVVRRRLGIPISLCVLAMEVGRRAGVGLVGVGLPGHFLARSTDEPSAYLDAFGGTLLSVEGVARVFASVSGGASLRAEYLAPVDHTQILRRMLNNLRAYFQRHFDEVSVRWTVELDLSLPDPAEETKAALAGCLNRLGQVAEAASRFEALADEAEVRGDEARARARRAQAAAARASLQ